MADRVERLEDHLFGTPENGYRDGVSPKIDKVSDDLATVKKRLSQWAIAIMAVIFATGMVNGKAVETIGAIAKAVFGG